MTSCSLKGAGYARSFPLFSLFPDHPHGTKSFLCHLPVFKCAPPLSFSLHPDPAEDGQQALGNERLQKPLFLCPGGRFWVPRAIPVLCRSGCLSLPAVIPLSPCSFQLHVRRTGTGPQGRPHPLWTLQHPALYLYVYGSQIPLTQSPLPSMIPGRRSNGWYDLGPWTKKSAAGGSLENLSPCCGCNPSQAGFRMEAESRGGTYVLGLHPTAQTLHCVSTILNLPNTLSGFSQPNHTQVTQISRMDPLRSLEKDILYSRLLSMLSKLNPWPVTHLKVRNKQAT